MRKIIIYILILLNILFTLTGCNANGKRTFVFTGESTTWAVCYTVEVNEKSSSKDKMTKYKNTVDRELEITLRDKNISPRNVENMKFALKSSSREASGDINFKEKHNDNGSISIKSSQVNASFENESDVVNVEISWNNKKETLSLKTK